MAGIAVFFGAWVAELNIIDSRLAYAVISAMLICAGGNSLNDYFDYSIDTINKPDKPIPSGKVHRNEALWLWLVTSISGLLLGFILGNLYFIIALITTVLLYAYNKKLKRTILYGNLTVSFITGLAFVYGGLLGINKIIAFVPAAFSLLFHFGRELVKDLEDKYGDSVEGISTLATSCSWHVSYSFIFLTFTLLIISTLLPYFLLKFSIVYFGIVIIGVDLILLITLIVLYFHRTKRSYRRLSILLKAGMLVGFLALYFK